jgi:transcriptional regulator with XRE-family HTH domain
MKLKDYLKKKKLSQREFSKLTGISTPTLSRIMNGTRTPRVENALIIQSVTKGSVKFIDMIGSK